MRGMRRGLWQWNWAIYPVVLPKSNRKHPWIYDEQLYKQRNQVERLFRRIFTRYDKLDVIFLAFVYFALIVDALMCTLPSIPSD